MELDILLQRSWVIIPSTSKILGFHFDIFQDTNFRNMYVGLLITCQSICLPIVLNACKRQDVH